MYYLVSGAWHQVLEYRYLVPVPVPSTGTGTGNLGLRYQVLIYMPVYTFVLGVILKLNTARRIQFKRKNTSHEHKKINVRILLFYILFLAPSKIMSAYSNEDKVLTFKNHFCFFKMELYQSGADSYLF